LNVWEDGDGDNASYEVEDGIGVEIVANEVERSDDTLSKIHIGDSATVCRAKCRNDEVVEVV